MDHPMQDDNAPPTQYTFYAHDQSYQLPYNAYPPMQHRLPDPIPYHNLAMLPQSHYPQAATPFPHAHHAHPQHTPPPPSPELYDPLSPPLSGSDSSADALYHHPSNSTTSTNSTNSAPTSPSSSRPHSLVHRTTRYNPSPSPTSSSTGRRRRSHSQDSDDDDFAIANSFANNTNMGSAPLVENLAHSRKEATRRQRIEAEQRRRDELRDGYAKLKDALPVSNQKSSKVSLLERAVNHIMALEKENKELQARIAFLEQESHRLRSLNEKISLHSEGTASPEPASARHNTTTPDAMIPSAPSNPANPPAGTTSSTLAHSLTSVRGQRPPSEHSSPSASEHGH